jgi:hypothetical protein
MRSAGAWLDGRCPREWAWKERKQPCLRKWFSPADCHSGLIAFQALLRINVPHGQRSILPCAEGNPSAGDDVRRHAERACVKVASRDSVELFGLEYCLKFYWAELREMIAQSAVGRSSQIGGDGSISDRSKVGSSVPHARSCPRMARRRRLQYQLACRQLLLHDAPLARQSDPVVDGRLNDRIRLTPLERIPILLLARGAAV